MKELLETARKKIQQEIASSEGEVSASEAVYRCFEMFEELLNNKI